MDDRPQDRPEDHRRRGPLGDEEDTAARRVTPEEGAVREGTTRTPASGRFRRRPPSREEAPETRSFRASAAREEEMTPAHPSSYMEASEVREVRLREIYGGVDYLASFIGSVFALVCAIILLMILSSYILLPLGFTLNLEGREIDTAIIIGLVIVGLILFVAYFCGGYVAGRLARFDGGRNGAVTVAWGILLSLILGLLLGGLLSGPLFEPLQQLMQASILPAVGSLMNAGLIGAGIVVGALLLELLGGFLGGRVGNSYHTHIDYTT